MKITITINNIKIKTLKNFTILQICENLNIFIPRFCYHSKLSIAGNCRMCLIEVKNNIKPIVACSTPIMENMEIFTNTPLVKKARENVLEFLLINHPLDCPICDQGGECDLQEQTLAFGTDFSRFKFLKRGVQNKNLGPLIKTIMTRCIHCTRCVRFGAEIGGFMELGTIGRGMQTEISNFLNKSLVSDLSGNIIDICPVGALTSKPFSFKARSWEIKKTTTIDCFNSLNNLIRIDVLNNKILRVLPHSSSKTNFPWISDRTRFSFDGVLYQRLDNPVLRIDSHKFVPISWESSFNIIKKELKKTDPCQILSLVDNFIDLESNYLIKYFFNRNGVKKIYSNLPFNNNKDYLKYIFNLEVFQTADLYLLIFCDLKNENILLNTQLKNKYLKTSCAIYTIGNKLNLTYPTIHLGSNLTNLLNILEGKSLICTKIKNIKYPLIILGTNFFKIKFAENILLFLQKYFYINIMYYETSIVNFIQNNIEYKKKFNQKNIKLYFFYNVQSNLKFTKNSFKIYQGTHFNDVAQQSNLLLPSLAYLEKQSSYLNILNQKNITNIIIKKNETPSDFLILKIYLLYYNFLIYKKIDIQKKLYFLMPNLNMNMFKTHKSLKLEKCSNMLCFKTASQIYVKSYYLDTSITQSSRFMALRTRALFPFFNNFKLC